MVRSIWKVNLFFNKRIKKFKKFKIYNSNFLISIDLIGFVFFVYTGNKFKKIIINDLNVNQVLSSLMITRYNNGVLHIKDKKKKKKKQMGNLVNPMSMRLNNNIYWNSQWVSYQNNKYSFLLSSDYLLYSYLNWFCRRNYFNRLGWTLFLSHYKVIRMHKNIIIIFFFKDYKFYKFVREYWEFMINSLKKKKYKKFSYKKSRIVLYLNDLEVKSISFVFYFYNFLNYKNKKQINNSNISLDFYNYLHNINNSVNNLYLFVIIYLFYYFFIKNNNKINNNLLQNINIFVYIYYVIINKLINNNFFNKNFLRYIKKKNTNILDIIDNLNVIYSFNNNILLRFNYINLFIWLKRNKQISKYNIKDKKKLWYLIKKINNKKYIYKKKIVNKYTYLLEKKKEKLKKKEKNKKGKLDVRKKKNIILKKKYNKIIEEKILLKEIDILYKTYLKYVSNKLFFTEINWCFNYFFNLKIKKNNYYFFSLLNKYFVKKKYLTFVCTLKEDIAILNEQRKKKINKKIIDLVMFKKRIIWYNLVSFYNYIKFERRQKYYYRFFAIWKNKRRYIIKKKIYKKM
jgi:ribosomal protein S19